jgi:tetratricopeptide (TPR) repeat protein
MTGIPPPSRLAITSLLDAIAFARQGKLEEAARELIGSAAVAEVEPSLITDVYHYAHAAIRLGLEARIDHPGLLRIIHVLKTEGLRLTGPDWVGDLYRDAGATGGSELAGSADRPAGGRAAALPAGVDLDHFTRDQLLRMGQALLRDGVREYERRDLGGALECFRAAFRIAKHLDDPEKIATCLFEMGFVIHSGGNGAFAEDHYRDALELLAARPPEAGGAVARYVFHAGRIFEAAGNAAKARDYFQKALAMFEAAGDAEGIRACREKLGSGPT